MDNDSNQGRCLAPTASRPQPRDRERLRRIVEAAHRHFNANGLERASFDAIAAIKIALTG